MNNPYDHALKILARAYPEAFLHLAFPQQSVRLLGTAANVELALEIDRVDFLHEVELAGIHAYFHTDFQLEHEADCPRRFYVYNAMLTELKKPTPVITLPIYLRPRVASLPKSYEVRVGETIFHKFTYEPIKLWEYVDQIRSGELYVFAPLLPLLVRPIDEALLVEERQLILTHERADGRQRTLLTTAILIAAQSELFQSDFLWELFQGDKMDLDNPIIAKMLDRAYGEKLAERREIEHKLQTELALLTQRATEAEAARREAEAEATRREAEAEATRREAEAEATRREAEAEAARQWLELMLKVLEHRFQSIPVALMLLLQSVKPALRSRATDALLDAPDVAACLQALRQLQNAENDGIAKRQS